MIAIVDYGAGNLRSVQKAFDSLEQESVITSDPSQVSRASKIVLPRRRPLRLDCQPQPFGPAGSYCERSRTRNPVLGHMRGDAMAVSGQRRIARHIRVGNVDRPLRAISGEGQIAACGLELLANRLDIAAVSGHRFFQLCLLHPLVSLPRR